jgi:two-component system, response regulator YesN
MITLLLVEDEAETREGLKKFIPMDSIGIDYIEEAADGLAAIDLCESIHPDILLTDVRMPKIDGIQLAFYIRERFPLCKIIFISGYSDKEYLKSAIKIGAISYIEKPIDESELTDALNQTVRQCLREQNKQREEESLDAITREGLPLIVQNLAFGACFDSQNGGNALLLAKRLGIGGEACLAVTLAVKVHDDAALTEYERELLRADIASFINSGVCQTVGMKQAACFLDSRTLIVHCFFPYDSSSEARSALMSALLSSLNGKYAQRLVFTAVAGETAASPADIYKSFRSSGNLLKTLFYVKRGLLYFPCDAEAGVFELPDESVNEFDGLILGGHPDETRKWLDNLETAIRMHANTDVGYVKNLFFRFYEQLFFAAKKRKAAISVIDGDYAYFWQELSRMETLHDITQYFHTLINSYFSAIGVDISMGFAMQEVIDYIKSNFRDQNLSIKKIAEYSHYDYYYLCSLFKKSTNMTLNDFIAKMRVEKAIDLLKDRHIRLHDVTSMVGYSDPSYFTKLFRKHVGVTPSEFREKYYS